MKRWKLTLGKRSLESILLTILGWPLGSNTPGSWLSWSSFILSAFGWIVLAFAGDGATYDNGPLVHNLSATGELMWTAGIILAVASWKERRSKELLLLVALWLILTYSGLFDHGRVKG